MCLHPPHPLQVLNVVGFLKFVHKLPKDKFDALIVICHLRNLAKSLVPDAKSKEPKGATFGNLPSYKDILRRFQTHFENYPREPKSLKQVIPFPLFLASYGKTSLVSCRRASSAKYAKESSSEDHEAGEGE